jgi:Zn-dependent M28 family amino/carboxypeptidase
MVGGHYDSWHAGTGATDDASGCAVALEAVRILKAVGVAPRRTIRVAFWSWEEGGKVGSRRYVEERFGPNRDTAGGESLSVYFNMDNGTGQFRGVYLHGNERVRALFAEWMAPFRDLRMATLTIDHTFGIDVEGFDLAGLPGFQFIQDPIDYDSRTHHSNMDVYDRLVPEDLRKNAVILATFLYRAAMMDESVPRETN